MLALSGDDIRQLVPMERAIDLVAEAFQELSHGHARAPLRTPIEIEPRATTLVMPAFVPAAAALGVKVVSVFMENPRRGLPTISALVTMFDRDTGQPLAVMDGTYLTALRTGAASGAATRILARADATVLTVIGAGTQAMTQARAVMAVRPIDRINVVSRSLESRQRFVDRAERDWPELARTVRVDRDLSAAVREADIICTATTSHHPVFDDGDVRPGTHVNGVGSFTPAMREIPGATVARALVVVDQAHAALEEAGDLVIPMREGTIEPEAVSRELGMVLAGDAPGRTDDEQVTVFKSVGNAIQDVVVGRFAVEEAERRGMGHHFRL